MKETNERTNESMNEQTKERKKETTDLHEPFDARILARHALDDRAAWGGGATTSVRRGHVCGVSIRYRASYGDAES